MNIIETVLSKDQDTLTEQSSDPQRSVTLKTVNNVQHFKVVGEVVVLSN